MLPLIDGPSPAASAYSQMRQDNFRSDESNRMWARDGRAAAAAGTVWRPQPGMTPALPGKQASVPASGYTAASPELVARIRSMLNAANLAWDEANANQVAGSKVANAAWKTAYENNKFDANQAYAGGMEQLAGAGLGRSGIGGGLLMGRRNDLFAANRQADAAYQQQQAALAEMVRRARIAQQMTMADVAQLRAAQATPASLMAGYGG